mgnify:FL=1|jgi:hypothetical protein|tara:strand:+ start:494 stop:673 length:180 start_codon:yes stop_codon:yes gene_type:complete
MTEINEEIKSVIDKNKAKAYEAQKEMRDDVAFYVLNCSVFDLQRMFKRMKELKNEKDNS